MIVDISEPPGADEVGSTAAGPLELPKDQRSEGTFLFLTLWICQIIDLTYRAARCTR
jgi:hypothetical protein